MKKFAMLALLLSLGVVTTGCNKPADKKTDAPAMTPESTAPADGAAAPAETPPTEPAK
ncbi:MAG TPA: hypothetical protein VGZ26_03785 [Pirellulales bacterium]|jgi:hypothetical protein|nr:hypothetical protein [Pirellulales bacterium]